MLAHDCRSRYSANTGDRTKKTNTRILFGDLFDTIFIPADPFVQSHELLAQIVDHLIGDVRQIENFTKCDVFGKPNHPG